MRTKNLNLNKGENIDQKRSDGCATSTAFNLTVGTIALAVAITLGYTYFFG